VQHIKMINLAVMCRMDDVAGQFQVVLGSCQMNGFGPGLLD